MAPPGSSFGIEAQDDHMMKPRKNDLLPSGRRYKSVAALRENAQGWLTVRRASAPFGSDQVQLESAGLEAEEVFVQTHKG